VRQLPGPLPPSRLVSSWTWRSEGLGSSRSRAAPFRRSTGQRPNGSNPSKRLAGPGVENSCPFIPFFSTPPLSTKKRGMQGATAAGTSAGTNVKCAKCNATSRTAFSPQYLLNYDGYINGVLVSCQTFVTVSISDLQVSLVFGRWCFQQPFRM